MLGIIPEWAIGVVVIISVVVVAHLLSGWLGYPFGAQNSRRKRPPAQRDATPDDVPGRAGELENMQRRIAELEERLDFAERLLAQRRDAERVAPPKS
jgi:hypothetical protein